MRKIITATFLSLDGVMQAPGGPDEDPTEGFTHGGWTVNYWDESMGQVIASSMTCPIRSVAWSQNLRTHYHPDYYAAFVLDSDGHNIEAVCHT
jgi:hypothetical protein